MKVPFVLQAMTLSGDRYVTRPDLMEVPYGLTEDEIRTHVQKTLSETWGKALSGGGLLSIGQVDSPNQELGAVYATLNPQHVESLCTVVMLPDTAPTPGQPDAPPVNQGGIPADYADSAE